MTGTSINNVRKTIDELLDIWKTDPWMLDINLTVIAFNDVAKQISPPVSVIDFKMPDLHVGGMKNIGGAFWLLHDCVNFEVKQDKHNHPIVILFTDDKQPEDLKILNMTVLDMMALPLFTFIAWTTLHGNERTYLNDITQYITNGNGDDIDNIIKHVFYMYDEGDLYQARSADWKYRKIVQKSQFLQKKNIDFPAQTAGSIVTPAEKVNLYKKGEISMSSLIRRLPVYLLVDCSGSMSGEPIEAVRQGIDTLVSELSSEPQALETAYLSVITFASTAQQVVPLTDLMSFTPPTINASGTTALGGALQVLRECINREVRKNSAEQKGDWKPLVFILTDGCPTDTDVFDQEVQNVPNMKTACIVACAAGSSADTSYLKRITNNVLMMNNLTPGDMAQFFAWVSGSVVGASKSLDAKPGAPINLAPPPTGFIVVP